MENILNLSFNIDNNKIEKGTIEGKLVTYGNIDRQSDIIQFGAFGSDIIGKQVPLLFNHNYNDGIGILEVVEDNAEGLFIKAKINLEDTKGKEIYNQINFGTYKHLSVGMQVKEDYFDDNGIWHITKAELLEGSVVAVPANDKASITSVKKLEKKESDNMEKLEKELETMVEDVKNMKSEVEKMVKENKSISEKMVGQVKVNKQFPQEDTSEKYLKSDEAVVDLNNAIQKSVSEGRGDVKLKTLWNNNVKEKGYTFEDKFPEKLVKKIEAKLQSHGLYQWFNKMEGITNYTFLIDTLGTPLAYQHEAGTQKTESNDTLKQLDVTADFIYRLQKVDRKMLVDNNTAAVTVEWIVDSLADAIIAFIEETAIKGDETATSLQAVIKSELLAKPESYGVTDTDLTLEGLMSAISYVKEKTGKEVAIIGGAADINKLRFAKDSNGAYLLPSAFGDSDTLLGCPVFNIDLKGQIVVLAKDAYTLISNKSQIETFTDFKLETNQNQFLSEIYVGGALTKLEGATVLGTSVGRASKGK